MLATAAPVFVSGETSPQRLRLVTSTLPDSHPRLRLVGPRRVFASSGVPAAWSRPRCRARREHGWCWRRERVWCRVKGACCSLLQPARIIAVMGRAACACDDQPSRRGSRWGGTRCGGSRKEGPEQRFFRQRSHWVTAYQL